VRPTKAGRKRTPTTEVGRKRIARTTRTDRKRTMTETDGGRKRTARVTGTGGKDSCQHQRMERHQSSISRDQIHRIIYGSGVICSSCHRIEYVYIIITGNAV